MSDFSQDSTRRPLWAMGLPSTNFRDPLVRSGADVRRCNRDTGKMHGPALPNGVQAADAGFGFSRYVGPWVTRSGFRVDFDGLNPRPAQAADLPRLMASGAVHSRLTARDFPTPREVVARALVGTSFMAGPTFDGPDCA